MNIHHRVAIINDYRDSFAFIEYNNWGSLEVCNASVSKSTSYSDTGIHIFINYNKISVCSSKEEAEQWIIKLINSFPKEANKMIKNTDSYLKECIFG